MVRTLTCLLLVACSGGDADDPTDGTTRAEVDPVPPTVGDLLIDELYYGGAAPPGLLMPAHRTRPR